MSTDPCSSEGATHYACDCTLRRAEALADGVRDLLPGCVFCDGTGTLREGFAEYPRYLAADGSCKNCYDARAALAAWEGRGQGGGESDGE